MARSASAGTVLEPDRGMTSMGWSAGLGVTVLLVGCAEADSEEIRADDQSMSQDEMGTAQARAHGSVHHHVHRRREPEWQRSRIRSARRGLVRIP